MPDAIISAADREETKEREISYGHSPCLALLRYFASRHSPWPDFLRMNPWAADMLNHMFELVARQLEYEFASPPRAAEQYCLTARRWMGSIAQNPDYGDVEIITETIRREKLLPHARGFPADELVTKSPNWHEQCARSIERLAAGRPISRLRSQSTDSSKSNPDANVFHPSKGKFSSSRPAKDVTDPYWLITHSVWNEVEEAMSSGKSMSLDHARAAFVVLLECINGIAEEDIQSVRINAEGGPCSIFPDSNRITLHIGSGFFPGGTCFQRSELNLPLPAELKWLLEATKTIGPGRLLDLWTPDGWLKAKDVIRAKAVTSGYATNPMDWSAHRIHREVAIMHLKQSVTEVSMIEGQAILGYRGPCSYLSIREDRAVQLFSATYHRTRDLMGFSRREFASGCVNPSTLHGKNVPSFYALIARLRSDVDRASNHNQVMACIERMMRLLGRRKSLLHPNPVQFSRRIPERMMLITDKIVGDSSCPHWLWLSNDLWKLIDALEARLGSTWPLLPYVYGSKIVSADQLGGIEAQSVHQIVHDTGFYPVARIAFRMAVRELGAGDEICNLAMGHAPTCGPLDFERPDSGAMMCAGVRRYLSELYRKYGLNEIAAALVKKLERYGNPDAWTKGLAWNDEGMRRFIPQLGSKKSLHLWSSHEDDWCERLWIALKKKKTFPANEHAQRTLLLVLTAVECGVPPTYLLRYSAYYTLGNFLRSDSLCRAWFLAATGDCDNGGRSAYPIGFDQGQSALWRYISESLRCRRRAGDRGCRRGIGWLMFQGVSADDIGLSVRKLLFGNATSKMNNADAFELLETFARIRSRYLHPGYVSGVLCEALPEVMNDFDIADVIRYHENVADLCTLDGRPFDMLSSITTRMPKSPALSCELETIALDASLSERAKAKRAWELIQDVKLGVPSKDWIKKRFHVCQTPSDMQPKRSGSRASRIARAILTHREKDSKLQLSKALRLPTPSEQASLRTQVYDYLYRCKPKLNKYLAWIDDEKEKEWRKIELKQQIAALGVECVASIFCLGIRTTESIRFLSERNGIKDAKTQTLLRSVAIFRGNLWCAIRGTKSSNAKRIARSYFCPWGEVTEELRSSLMAHRPAILYGTKERVKNAVESVGASLHLIRHWAGVAAVKKILGEHYLDGSALLILESHARSMGHGSMITTFLSYLGTAMESVVKPAVYEV